MVEDFTTLRLFCDREVRVIVIFVIISSPSIGVKIVGRSRTRKYCVPTNTQLILPALREFFHVYAFHRVDY